MTDLKSNVFDTALIFEGGGMRASYTCAIANALLKEGIYFDHVYGVSAGSSNTVNYLSRDTERTRKSFLDIVEYPHFSGMRYFLTHRGWFYAENIYQEMGKPGNMCPFDLKTFLANPAKATICGIERDTGKTRYWTKDDMPTLDDLMRRVRASSTLPIAMPPLKIDGEYCYDGGLGEGNGLLIPKAKADGFDRFFIVRTRPKSFRKPELPNRWVRRFFWRRPLMQQALDAWGPGYNDMCNEAERLEESGQALVVYAEDMTAENTTVDLAILQQNYAAGEAQAARDMPKWKAFLGL
jgi:predicted patatin/cPLA2 family phospholipase